MYVTYSDRVTRDRDGVYRWRGIINREQRLFAVKVTLGVVGGTCLLLILMGLFIGMDGEAMTVTLLSIGGAMLITIIITLLYFKFSEGGYQAYEMTEDYLHYVGGGKSDTYMNFKHIRRVRVVESQSLLEVRTTLVVAPFFVPREDFSLVLNYVLQRLPDKATVTYE